MTQSIGILACHECDQLHRREPIPAGARANCQRCGNLLYRHIPDSLNRALALYLAALLLFLIANGFPLLSLKVGGRVEENILLSGAWAMYQAGMGTLGLLIFSDQYHFPHDHDSRHALSSGAFASGQESCLCGAGLPPGSRHCAVVSGSGVHAGCADCHCETARPSDGSSWNLTLRSGRPAAGLLSGTRKF